MNAWRQFVRAAVVAGNRRCKPAAPRGAKGFDYYSLKDRAMAETAEYGLILWNGKSKGTANNVVNLTRNRKPVVVYVGPVKKFRTVRTADDLKCLLAEGDSDSVDRVVNEPTTRPVQAVSGRRGRPALTRRPKIAGSGRKELVPSWPARVDPR